MKQAPHRDAPAVVAGKYFVAIDHRLHVDLLTPDGTGYELRLPIAESTAIGATHEENESREA
jgi:hypothetical protein